MYFARQAVRLLLRIQQSSKLNQRLEGSLSKPGILVRRQVITETKHRRLPKILPWLSAHYDLSHGYFPALGGHHPESGLVNGIGLKEVRYGDNSESFDEAKRTWA